MKKNNDCVRWLRQQDAESLAHRSARLGYLLQCCQGPEPGFMFRGGTLSLRAFEEARLAFINGLYLSVPLITLTFVELELCGLLYAAGFEPAKSAKIGVVQAEAQARGMLTPEEVTKLDKLRTIRNSLTHFRPPLDARSVTGRQFEENSAWFELLKRDAEWAVGFMYEFIAARG